MEDRFIGTAVFDHANFHVLCPDWPVVFMPQPLGDSALSFTHFCLSICLPFPTFFNFLQRFLALCIMDWFDIWSEELSGWVVPFFAFQVCDLSNVYFLFAETGAFLSNRHIFAMLFCKIAQTIVSLVPYCLQNQLHWVAKMRYRFYFLTLAVFFF